jgi:hypothetical protein
MEATPSAEVCLSACTQARTDELESLDKAKSVLNGARELLNRAELGVALNK